MECLCINLDTRLSRKRYLILCKIVLEPNDILFDDLGFDEPVTSDISDLRMNNFDYPSYFRRFESKTISLITRIY